MEGDGPLVLYAYQKLSTLYAHVTLSYHPNVLAVADELAQGVASHKTQLINYPTLATPLHTVTSRRGLTPT